MYGCELGKLRPKWTEKTLVATKVAPLVASKVTPLFASTVAPLVAAKSYQGSSLGSYQVNYQGSYQGGYDSQTFGGCLSPVKRPQVSSLPPLHAQHSALKPKPCRQNPNAPTLNAKT